MRIRGKYCYFAISGDIYTGCFIMFRFSKNSIIKKESNLYHNWDRKIHRKIYFICG